MVQYSLRFAIPLLLALLATGLCPLSVQGQHLLAEGYQIQYHASTAPMRVSIELEPGFRALGLGPYLFILDTSDAAAPSVVAELPLSGTVTDLVRDGNTLYLAANIGGLRIVDITNYYAPREIGVWQKDPITHVALNRNGKFIFGSTGSSAIRVLKVKNPYKPKSVLRFGDSGALYGDLVVTGSILIAAAGSEGIHVYDIADPKGPIIRKRFKELEGVSELDIQGHLVAACDVHLGLALVNFPTWKTPKLKGVVGFDIPPSDCAFLGGSTGKVAVALGSSGFAVVEAANPQIPTVLSHPAQPAPVIGVSPDGAADALYLHCGSSGLWHSEASGPDPVVRRLLDGAQTYRCAAAKGNWVYLGSENGTLHVWNLEDPLMPARGAEIALPAPPTHLSLEGDLLLASCLEAGVALLDVSQDPSLPSLIHTLVPRDAGVEGACHQASAAGDLLAVADGTNGVQVYDIADPAAPAFYGSWTSDKGFVVGADFESESQLWLTHSVQGIVGLDTSTGDLEETGSRRFNAPNVATLEVYGEAAYVNDVYGTYVIEISDPENPEEVDFIGTGSANHAVVSSETLLLAQGYYGGLGEWCLNDPLEPYQTTLFDSPGFAAASVATDSGARLLVDVEGGIWVLAHASCAGERLLLPCDGEAIPYGTPPLFTWDPGNDMKFRVEVSISPAFPSGKRKTITSKDKTAKYLKVPSWRPAAKRWTNIIRLVDGNGVLYWRVKCMDASENATYTETRTFSVNS